MQLAAAPPRKNQKEKDKKVIVFQRFRLSPRSLARSLSSGSLVNKVLENSLQPCLSLSLSSSCPNIKRTKQAVQWSEDVVDNEMAGKKSSKSKAGKDRKREIEKPAGE